MAASLTARDIGDELAERLAELDPLWAAECGLSVATLPRLDPEWWAARRDLFADILRDLEAGPAGRDADILRERAEAEVLWIDSGEAFSELQAALDGTLFRIRFLFDNLPADTADARDRARAVEAAVPSALAGFRQTLDLARSRGQVASRRQVLATIEAVDEWVADGAPAGAAFAEMADYLRREYLADAADRDAVGRERFDVWARRYTGAVIGETEFESVTADLDETFADLAAIQRDIDAAGPSLVLTTEAEHLAWAEAEVGRAGAACTAAGVLPERSWPSLAVRPFDGNGQQAYYAGAARDGSAGATVWVAAGDGPHYVDYERTVLFHESIPGHHVEATLQSEADQLSRYQQLLYLPAHSEGWGLYAERLAEDAGLIQTPHARSGRLGSRALRLASFLIDVGTHTQQWSGDRSAALLTRVGLEPHVADWWLTNMIGRPCHRAAYVLGEQVWTDLVRQNTEVPRSVFHDAALSAGPMSLASLRSLSAKELIKGRDERTV